MSKFKKNKLSISATMKLIDEIKEHPCLWDPSDPNYNERYTISKTWIKISEDMDLPADFLRAKWKNLRDMYVKLLKKCRTPEAYTGGWRFFAPLGFLNRSYNEESEDSEASVVFETLYDDESPISERNVKMEADARSSDEDPIVSAPEKRRRVDDTENDEEDYDIMFLKSLAPYFRKLDTMRKLVVRSRMQDMLMNEIAAQQTEGFKRTMGDV
ncbi:hypothetical protein K1T71_007490 [Dendrolimus kikuchii]|uniref:Uncharacterized protein n=1 Tax=Dendrolimus kikuchii TaxID=765133 RepID=A0ACC1D0K6_9NEOP|nr:hypothetical protein K1T71_007490 [Dendrolimus kikuchii]